MKGLQVFSGPDPQSNGKAVDENLMREQHPSMPITSDRQSRVTFGGEKINHPRLRKTMANSNVAFGLKPIGIQGQAPNSTGLTEYRIASGNSNAIYQGSPVIPLSGFIDIVENLRG